MTKSVQEVDPQTVKKWIDSGDALLIDVREKLEYNEEHIPKAQLFPTTHFDPKKLPEPQGKKIVFYCHSGRRSALAAKKWVDQADSTISYNLAGGIVAWKKASFPIVENIAVERRIEHQGVFIAGLLVLLGCVLTCFFGQFFLIIPGVTGILLIIAGIYGHSYVSHVLSLLPFNR